MSAAWLLLRKIPPLWYGIAVLIALIAIQSFRLDRAQKQRHEAGLALENAKARVDTLKTIEHLSAKDSAALGLGDSLQVLTQRVVQQKQQRDQLDKALDQERTANLSLTASIAELRAKPIASTGAVSIDSNDVRSARFSFRQAPFSLFAVARLPKIGQASLDSLAIKLDTAKITVRLGCGAENVAGVRSAQLTLIASEWLKFGAPKIEQSDEICAKVGNGGAGPRSRWKPALTLGYGATAFRDSTRKIRVAHGPSLLFGWTIWP